MKLTHHVIGRAVVIEVHGKLIGGPDDHVFHELVKTLLAEGRDRFVVDLGDTPWANSQGVGLLIGAYTSVARAGGHLVLTNVPKRIHDILRVTRLYVLFETFERFEDAVAFVSQTDFQGAAARVGGRRRVPSG